jgi:hypothetical protein
MRALFVAALCGVTLGLCEPAAFAQTRGTAGYTARLVPFLCGGAPCNVSGITFSRGDVHLIKLKQSQLVFNTFVGEVSLQDVVPPLKGLQARLSATLSYGADPTSACAQANTQVVVSPWATSSLTCTPPEFGFAMPCRGELHLTALTPPGCAEVDVTVENISAAVYESGFVGDPAHEIAGDGMIMGGQTPDCSSGGLGQCP